MSRDRCGDPDEKTKVAILMPAVVASYCTLTKTEREAVVARARVELLRLTLELSGDEHARLESDVNAWILAEPTRVELFWREPEKAVWQALRSQLREAMAARGLDMAKLEGN